MSNIVKQLRHEWGAYRIANEAADEIERLRAEIKRLDEIERLRAQVDCYGLALMMIAEGAAFPQNVARNALDKARAALAKAEET